MHNFVLQKESIVARLHFVFWYIRFQDDNRNNLLARCPIVLIITLDLETFIKNIMCTMIYGTVWQKLLVKDGKAMQVPCKLRLSGQPKFVSLLRKELMKMKEI